MRSCFGAIVWLLACSLFALPATAAPNETVLAAPAASMWIEQGVELLHERPGEPLTREQVMSGAAASRWVQHGGKKVNLSHLPAALWIRFTVRNDGSPSPDWLLAIDWPQLHAVDLHRLDPDAGTWHAPMRAAIGEPLSAGAARDPSYRFELPLHAGQRATVLLRVQADQYTVPLKVWRQDAYRSKQVTDTAFFGALFGVLLVMLLYNLSLLVFTRDRSYLDYSLYLAAVILFEAAGTGFDRLYLWPDSLWLQTHAFHFFGCVSFLAAATFIRRFLDLKHARPHLNRINQGLIVFWCVQIPLLLVLPAHVVDPISRSVGLFEALAVIYTSVFLLLQGHLAARYFAIAWATIAVASIATSLFSFGLIDGGWLVENAQHIGFVVETVLLSIALADRIKRERTSKEVAQLRALEATRQLEVEREHKIQAQAEALALQQRTNEELERRVAQRTQELQQAMKDLAAANSELSKLSITDGLTKVYNRRYFDDALRNEYERATRNLVPLTLIMIDIDHFKRINDTVGHVGGDECLKLVAATLAATVSRLNDLVARYGGEEFAVMLPSTPPEQVPVVAERLRRAVEAIAFIHRGERVPLSISLGAISAVPNAHEGIFGFVARADDALYAAKKAGRNCFKLVSDAVPA
ncbi:MAG: diguanylate cyclase [Burkholderiaceae bacterium]|nr:diguanylate cyclase [Burkholderiaceae bacterium]